MFVKIENIDNIYDSLRRCQNIYANELQTTQILIYFPSIILCIHDLYTNYLSVEIRSFKIFLDKFNDILVNINNNRNNQRKCMTFTYF